MNKEKKNTKNRVVTAFWRTLSALCVSALLMQNALGAKPDFKDMVPKDHWAYESLCYAYEAGAIKGFEDGTLRPDDHLTRAQMATVIVRLYGTGARADISKFPDVVKGEWYWEYLEEAYAMNLFKGDSEGNMNPDKDILRSEVFTVICRLLGLEAVDGGTDFSDDAQIAAWAKGSIKALKVGGYISGDGEKRVNAANPITRAEFAKLLYNVKNRQEEAAAKAAEEAAKKADEKNRRDDGGISFVVVTDKPSNKVKRSDYDKDPEGGTESGSSGKESWADDIFDDGPGGNTEGGNTEGGNTEGGSGGSSGSESWADDIFEN